MNTLTRQAIRTSIACLLAVCLSLVVALRVIPQLAKATPTEDSAADAASSSPTQELQILDTVFENGRAGVPVTVVVPAEGEGWPLVVFCHGFTANRKGDGHFAPLQRQLAEVGIASVAPDFAGCGESAEPSTAYTLASMQADLDAVIAAMAAAYPVDTTRLGLVGHSMGGRVASLYLAGGAYPARAAALWSPANGAALRGLEFLDSEDFARVSALADEAKAQGSCAAGRFDFVISGEFVAGMEASRPNDLLAETDAALLLCYAGHEDLFSAETVAETTAAVTAQGGTVLTEPFAEAGHNYTAYGDESNAAMNAPLDEALRTATLQFLQSAL